MNELLSPSGTKEAFYAAISNGANAIYLGLDKFSARAYAENFTLDNLKELVDFAHLRNVKIYVTINTIIYDYELKEAYECIDKLAQMHVDAIIVQDLAILNYITSSYSSIHAHASTQMGIDDVEGAKLVKELGATRIVLARETPLETIKDIKNNVDIELEDFIHGALCVGYSGNCLMSSSIGERSGNRGRCAGCCRKPYSLYNLDLDKVEKTGYLLSMKDLNVSNEINKLKIIDSFKIEGRMKEPTYVAAVTRYYRELLDNKKPDKVVLDKVFNRTYTKGLINNEEIKDLTNIERPNNYGYEIGVVDRFSKNKLWIKLFKPLNKGDQIRVENPNSLEEISIPVLNLYNSSFEKVESLPKMAIVDYRYNDIKVGAKVYKTKDIRFNEEVSKILENKEYSKLDIDIEFSAYIGKPIFLKVQYDKFKAFVKSDYIVEMSESSATTKENIINQLDRLNDTPYKLRKSIINIDENVFIPLKLINELRREAIDKLNESRLNLKVIKNDHKEIIVKKYDIQSPIITVEVSNEAQYQKARELGINNIYFKNIIRRNNAKYLNDFKEVLVGGLSGISYYKDKDITVVSDYSLNVVNYKTLAILNSLGVDRITISNEISKDNIEQMIEDYHNVYNTYPNLEMIVYGRTKLMHTKYCVLNRLGMCGKCKENKFALKDDFGYFPLMFNDDCTMTILNSKTFNILDDAPYLKNINYFRLVFTNESVNEVERIINCFRDKLNGKETESLFDKEYDTRGHFNKNPL